MEYGQTGNIYDLFTLGHLIQYVMRKVQTESAKQQGIETVMKYNFMWDRYGIKFIVRQPGHTVHCEVIMQYSSY
jgi:hypothetical protein